MKNDSSSEQEIRKTVVVSVGGSLVSTKEGTNIRFMKDLASLFRKLNEKSCSLVVYIGGGWIAREYQQIARKNHASDDDLDMIGIRATRMNATLFRTFLGDDSAASIIKNPFSTEISRAIANKRIAVAAGWKPGWSTDYDAVMTADMLGVKRVVNATNIDHVYTKKPLLKGAKPINKMSWEEYISLVGQRWVPGKNAPFDPVASIEARKKKITVLILDGSNLKNLEKAIGGGAFDGTTIS